MNLTIAAIWTFSSAMWFNMNNPLIGSLFAAIAVLYLGLGLSKVK